MSWLLMMSLAFASDDVVTTGAACPVPKAAIGALPSASPAGVPAIDTRPPAHLRTATFALG